MNISKEAVEAAAERLHFWRGHVVEWKSMHEAAKDGWRAEARAALEAAAPLLMAQAWDEGEEAGYGNAKAEDWPTFPQQSNPYRP